MNMIIIGLAMLSLVALIVAPFLKDHPACRPASRDAE